MDIIFWVLSVLVSYLLIITAINNSKVTNSLKEINITLSKILSELENSKPGKKQVKEDNKIMEPMEFSELCPACGELTKVTSLNKFCSACGLRLID